MTATFTARRDPAALVDHAEMFSFDLNGYLLLKGATSHRPF